MKKLHLTAMFIVVSSTFCLLFSSKCMSVNIKVDKFDCRIWFLETSNERVVIISLAIAIYRYIGFKVNSEFQHVDSSIVEH